MTGRQLVGALCLIVGAAPFVRAQASLSTVEGTEPNAVRRQCARLRPVLARVLNAQDAAEFGLLVRGDEPVADFAEKVQNILDPYCLVGVSINPESRVKAARGPLKAELVRGEERIVIVKVQNDAGVTQGLKVASDQLRTAKKKDKLHWLEASIDTRKPLEDKLTGHKLEYVILRLTAHEAGKREATLKFDVGQGTQDLGFRAEVPILFTVKEKK